MCGRARLGASASHLAGWPFRSSIEEAQAFTDSLCCARSIFTILAAISLASDSALARTIRPSWMCTYWRSRFTLQVCCGLRVPFAIAGPVPMNRPFVADWRIERPPQHARPTRKNLVCLWQDRGRARASSSVPHRPPLHRWLLGQFDLQFHREDRYSRVASAQCRCPCPRRAQSSVVPPRQPEPLHRLGDSTMAGSLRPCCAG